MTNAGAGHLKLVTNYQHRYQVPGTKDSVEK